MISALLVPALAGFVLLFGTHLFRYWLNRQGGYKLLFVTALAGAVLLALARGVVVFVGKERVPQSWYDYAPFEMSETVALSLLIAIVCAFLINCVCGRPKAARLVSRNTGDLVECLLEDCLERNGLVELTMSNGKAYIGFPRESGLTVTGESDIAIVPLASGYRDETPRIRRPPSCQRGSGSSRSRPACPRSVRGPNDLLCCGLGPSGILARPHPAGRHAPALIVQHPCEIAKRLQSRLRTERAEAGLTLGETRHAEAFTQDR